MLDKFFAVSRSFFRDTCCEMCAAPFCDKHFFLMSRIAGLVLALSRSQMDLERSVLAAHDRAFEDWFSSLLQRIQKSAEPAVWQEQRYLPKLWDCLDSMGLSGKAHNFLQFFPCWSGFGSVSNQWHR